MARGRMINNRITMDKAINDLSDDTSRLAFTWLITFADSEGRTYGDPALVASTLFPRRRDVTPEQMAGYINEWENAGLIHYYQADDDWWIEFPAFAKNQRGLDRRKEPESCIPAPDGYVPGTEEVRTGYVPSTAEENRTEENRTEVEVKAKTKKTARTNDDHDDTPPSHNTTTLQISKAWAMARGSLCNSLDAERLTELEAEYTAEWVLDAIREANDARSRGSHISINYVKAFLERWEQEGRDTPFDPDRKAKEDELAADEAKVEAELDAWNVRERAAIARRKAEDAAWTKEPGPQSELPP